MIDVEKWQKLGAFIAANWLAFLVGGVAGATVTAGLYEKFVMPALRYEIDRFKLADQSAPASNRENRPTAEAGKPSGVAQTEIRKMEPLLNATAHVRVEGRGADGRPWVREGSGIFLTQNGRILTVSHLLDGSVEARTFSEVKITVTGDRSAMERKATVLKLSKTVGLALLQLDDGGSVATASFASKGPNLGDEVLMIGFAHGQSKTVLRSTVTRISALGVGIQGQAGPGFGGAPAFDRGGLLIGIVMSGSEDGINAIPVELAREFARL
ncbi:MAG: trypsin-like peptidase domain-containing protein [Betaproteobacteria bacterium]|nr:trypsin-like peptidase domain-containing protein [Betaproteobacteria bacterium]